jgi:hypothetical protein
MNQNIPLEITECDECGSLYYKRSSKMESLCPECSNILYGYHSCIHKFENGRCIKCYWDGSVSDYIRALRKTMLLKLPIKKIKSNKE